MIVEVPSMSLGNRGFDDISSGGDRGSMLNERNSENADREGEVSIRTEAETS